MNSINLKNSMNNEFIENTIFDLIWEMIESWETNEPRTQDVALLADFINKRAKRAREIFVLIQFSVEQFRDDKQAMNDLEILFSQIRKDLLEADDSFEPYLFLSGRPALEYFNISDSIITALESKIYKLSKEQNEKSKEQKNSLLLEHLRKRAAVEREKYGEYRWLAPGASSETFTTNNLEKPETPSCITAQGIHSDVTRVFKLSHAGV